MASDYKKPWLELPNDLDECWVQVNYYNMPTFPATYDAFYGVFISNINGTTWNRNFIAGWKLIT